jgi:hypothetical protein
MAFVQPEIVEREAPKLGHREAEFVSPSATPDHFQCNKCVRDGNSKTDFQARTFMKHVMKCCELANDDVKDWKSKADGLVHKNSARNKKTIEELVQFPKAWARHLQDKEEEEGEEALEGPSEQEPAPPDEEEHPPTQHDIYFLFVINIFHFLFHFFISSSKFQVPSFKFQASSFKFQASSSKFQVSSFKFQISSFKFQVSSFDMISYLMI